MILNTVNASLFERRNWIEVKLINHKKSTGPATSRLLVPYPRMTIYRICSLEIVRFRYPEQWSVKLLLERSRLLIYVVVIYLILCYIVNLFNFVCFSARYHRDIFGYHFGVSTVFCFDRYQFRFRLP